MKVKIGKIVKDLRALRLENTDIKMIDQRALPSKLKIFNAKNYKDVIFAINEMAIRGAPALGAIAAYTLAQAIIQSRDIKGVVNSLRKTRPTAYDLFYAIDYMLNGLKEGKDAVELAENYVDKLIDSCKKIGEYGERLIKNKARILTHCNAGALATVDYGTALAPIRKAHYNKKKIFVYVSETRPRMQGLLTSWELVNEGIEHAIIADNAVGYFMEKGEIDIVIVGADRIASNGDVANKIGTYEKAVLAKENKIPFWVCAPTTTFDFSVKSGKEIKIEERRENEILEFCGKRVAPKLAKARNPAFDITSAKYISGYVTERGIIKTPRKL
jgi:translation initiation factor eIF-2B subunit alpha/methylthioribose-1-phosphate isomerase